ncbi:hypothetical protein GCM10025857_38420 [Alicyclobacillus contaminans]|nr:hypothetical protein GCM10025857_38420 [Alicyclobacillus contaminans]
MKQNWFEKLAQRCAVKVIIQHRQPTRDADAGTGHRGDESRTAKNGLDYRQYIGRMAGIQLKRSQYSQPTFNNLIKFN